MTLRQLNADTGVLVGEYIQTFAQHEQQCDTSILCDTARKSSMRAF